MACASDHDQCKIFFRAYQLLQKVLKGICQDHKALTNLISGENADKKKALVVWTPKCQEAFDQLKKLCTEAPVLTYPDFTKPFKLHIDACDWGLGAILYQDQPDGRKNLLALLAEV